MSGCASTAVNPSNVTLSPKHAGGVTELSRQLIMQSSPDVEQLVRDDFAAVLAQAIDSALIKGGGVQLVQARPYSGPPTEKIYDIIDRIKKGYYAGADYVLFGTVSNIAFRQETMQLPGTSSYTGILSLDLVADFSLIDTKTYAVKAAFSASGALTSQASAEASGAEKRFIRFIAVSPAASPTRMMATETASMAKSWT